jgi:hypothetical protein
MDTVVEHAARALALGDPLRALQGVALRNDAAALALRGIAMAQLGELTTARKLLRRAARSFGARQMVERARCVVAEAEITLANRDTWQDDAALTDALAVLTAHGDETNAAQAALVVARRSLLLGRLEDAGHALANLYSRRFPPRVTASAQLLAAEIATRRSSTREARRRLERARVAADRSQVPALIREVRAATARLDSPAARVLEAGNARLLRLEEIEALNRSQALIVDACRREVRQGRSVAQLIDRPVLFDLLWGLAEAAPIEATRESLARRAFGSQRMNDSVRVRLRVELGRLRKLLGALLEIRATVRGFELVSKRASRILLLTPPADTEGDALLALLSDGQAWSTSALAQALGKSQRTVQRALAELGDADKVSWFGRGGGRRWLTPTFTATRFATPLLLVPLPRPR